MKASQPAGLAVFVKTPELSEVKTRLAQDIGRENAREVYERSLQVCEEACHRAMEQAQGKLQCYWAVGEAEGVKHPRWKGIMPLVERWLREDEDVDYPRRRRFPAIYTGDGGLGSRLASVQDWLLERHDRAVLIGSDCPQLTPELLVSQSLRADGISIGPTTDGGFYLFSSAELLERTHWKSIKYSSPATLGQLLKLLSSHKIELLAEETDIDDAPSLLSAVARLESGSFEAQVEMAKWMKSRDWWYMVSRNFKNTEQDMPCGECHKSGD